jgi:hypothetical protein
LYSVCQYAAVINAPVTINSTSGDPLFANSQVLIDRGVQSLLGYPLTQADGSSLGAVIAIDTQPRSWSARDEETIGSVSLALVAEIQRTIVYSGRVTTLTSVRSVIDLNQMVRDSTVLLAQSTANRLICDLDLLDPLPLVMVGNDWYSLMRHILAEVEHSAPPHEAARIATQTRIELVHADDQPTPGTTVVVAPRPGCYAALVFRTVEGELVANVIARILAAPATGTAQGTLHQLNDLFGANGGGLRVVIEAGVPSELCFQFRLA